MTTCIYCRATSSDAYQREHVIPKQFGTFRSNLVIRCVCPECNQFFGRTLERDFGGDTAEGILRLDFGLRSAKMGVAPSKGIEITVRTPGPWYGAKALIKPHPTGKGTHAELLAQVGMKLPGSDEWTWYPEPEINDKIASRYRNGGRQFVVTGPTPADRERLREKLLRLGVKIQRQEEHLLPLAGTGGRLGINIHYSIHHTASRCIAKNCSKLPRLCPRSGIRVEWGF